MEAEIQGYLTEFGTLRGAEFRDAIKGLNDDGANWHPLSDGTNSTFAILSHIMGADNLSVRQVISGEEVQRGCAGTDFRASGNLSELLVRWEEAWTEIESIYLGRLNHSQLLEAKPVPFRPDRGTVTVQWVILHLISHYATHLGHLQLTRQLWDQRQRN